MSSSRSSSSGGASGAEAAPEDRAVYARALRAILVLVAVGALVAAGVGFAIADSAGVVAALAGVAVGALAALVTPGAMLAATGKPAHVLGAIVAGAWLGKMVLIVIALAVLASVESLHRGVFGWTVIGLVLASLAIDLWAVKNSRVPYVAGRSSQSP